jgi:hypothetical protein
MRQQIWDCKRAANRRIRLKRAGFPALKALENFDLTTSSIPRPTFEYVGSLEWIRAAEYPHLTVALRG